jgi:hypothetical protein
MATTIEGLAHLGAVDGAAVADVVAGLARIDEARWWAEDFRQSRFPDAHGATQTLFARYHWAGIAIVDDDLLELLGPVLAGAGRLVRAHSGGRRCAAGNVLVVRLPAGCEVGEHTDAGRYLKTVWRLHIPLLVNDGCTFTVGGVEHHPAVGAVYRLANRRPHAAANRGASPRLHLITDWLVDGDDVRTR